MILSIDCGTSNFAYCIIDSNTVNNEVIDKKLVNIKKDIGKKSNCMIESYTLYINKLMDNIYQLHAIEEVLIEKLMISNSKCSIIMSSIILYCVFKGLKYIIVKPKLKGCISIGKYVINKTKNNHTNNKNASKFDITKIMGYKFEEYKKKDDLCDTVMQYLGYKKLLKQLNICLCETYILNDINTIIKDTQIDIKNKQKNIASLFNVLPKCCKI